jgi:hypothetical protein
MRRNSTSRPPPRTTCGTGTRDQHPGKGTDHNQFVRDGAILAWSIHTLQNMLPGLQYDLRITGVAETWKKPKRAEWIKPGGPTEDTMTRLEFEILNGKGKGRRFTSQVNCVVGPKSNLGQVWMAAVGPIPTSIEIMDLLDKELTMYVERNEGVDNSGNKKVYANPTWSTAKPIGSAAAAEDEWPAA